MKILNINSYFFSSTVHRELNAILIEKKIDTYTYVPVARNYTGREGILQSNLHNVKKVECYNYMDRFFFHIKHSKIFKNIIESIEMEKVECVHAHSLFSNGCIALKLKKKYGKPYIVAVRDTDVNIFFKKMLHLRRLGNEILEEAEAVIFLSSSYRDAVIKKYVKNKKKIFSKSHVIPNGIDEFWLENKNKPKEIDNKEVINFLHVGSINKRKNILTTIKALELIQKKGYKVKYTVVGKVLDKKIYKKILNYDFITYLPSLPPIKLLEIYRNNDIFIMPSITESFGLVYAEAMSQGLPVIYTRGQGFDGQFPEGEIGHSTSYNKVEEISEKIISIINNYRNKSMKCVDNAVAFSWKDISQQYISLYDEITKDNL